MEDSTRTRETTTEKVVSTNDNKGTTVSVSVGSTPEADNAAEAATPEPKRDVSVPTEQVEPSKEI